MPDFPSELVEAAAKALASEWHMVSKDLRARWDSVLPDDNPGVPENWLARAVLATVVPLIEQRVVERLAKQAGTNPYADADSVDFDPYMRDGWFEGAACGVAAERERVREAITRLVREARNLPPSEKGAMANRCDHGITLRQHRGVEETCVECGAKIRADVAGLVPPAEPDTEDASA